MCILLVKVFCLYLFERQGARAPILWHLDLPCEWWGSKSLSGHLLALTAQLSEVEIQSADLEPWHFDVGCRASQAASQLLQQKPARKLHSRRVSVNKWVIGNEWEISKHGVLCSSQHSVLQGKGFRTESHGTNAQALRHLLATLEPQFCFQSGDNVFVTELKIEWANKLFDMQQRLDKYLVNF